MPETTREAAGHWVVLGSSNSTTCTTHENEQAVSYCSNAMLIVSFITGCYVFGKMGWQ